MKRDKTKLQAKKRQVVRSRLHKTARKLKVPLETPTGRARTDAAIQRDVGRKLTKMGASVARKMVPVAELAALAASGVYVGSTAIVMRSVHAVFHWLRSTSPAQLHPTNVGDLLVFFVLAASYGKARGELAKIIHDAGMAAEGALRQAYVSFDRDLRGQNAQLADQIRNNAITPKSPKRVLKLYYSQLLRVHLRPATLISVQRKLPKAFLGFDDELDDVYRRVLLTAARPHASLIKHVSALLDVFVYWRRRTPLRISSLDEEIDAENEAVPLLLNE